MTAAARQPAFSAEDLRQMREHGLTEAEVQRQLALFRNPPAAPRLARPATVGDGILSLDKGGQLLLEVAWADLSSAGHITKVTPASGAASRMFHRLEALHAGGGASDTEALEQLLDEMERFAFFEDLEAALGAAGHSLEELRRKGDIGTILDHLLTKAGGNGLGYSTLPKGLVRFHRYPGERRTAFEEHLVESVGTVRDEEGVCRLHFTVSPEHQAAFEECLEEVRKRYETRYECTYDVSFSHQSTATDTLAVDLDDQPFRDDAGRLLFRPSGHGALLDNLAQLDARVAVIKTIDNVVPEKHQELVLLWKRLLLGKMTQLQQRTFDLLSLLESTGGDSDDILDDGADLAGVLGHPMPESVTTGSAAKRRAWLVDRLDRPLRVCGVVANQGEPGGGPFWVQAADGSESLQIIEGSQIDSSDPSQAEIFAESTHFNPVDLACSLTDSAGMPYPLEDYVDEGAAFITEKSHQGRPLKTLERPGLWNGAMAGWNTVFIEVPLATFAPVKTATDLLRDAHQTGVRVERS